MKPGFTFLLFVLSFQCNMKDKKKKSNTQTVTVLLNTVYQSQGCCGSTGQPAGMFSLVLLLNHHIWTSGSGTDYLFT